MPSILLREGANRAFHEAIGELAAIASQQPPYLQAIGVLPPRVKIARRSGGCSTRRWSRDSVHRRGRRRHHGALRARPLRERAAAGRVAEALVGVRRRVPGRGAAGGRDRPTACDACTKTHINDDAGGSTTTTRSRRLIKYQLHDHICTKILKQDPHACNYYGHKEVGDFLQVDPEAGRDAAWRRDHEEATGEPISTRAMMAYFKPLDAWLDQELKGKPVGW